MTMTNKCPLRIVIWMISQTQCQDVKHHNVIQNLMTPSLMMILILTWKTQMEIGGVCAAEDPRIPKEEDADLLNQPIAMMRLNQIIMMS